MENPPFRRVCHTSAQVEKVCTKQPSKASIQKPTFSSVCTALLSETDVKWSVAPASALDVGTSASQNDICVQLLLLLVGAAYAWDFTRYGSRVDFGWLHHCFPILQTLVP